MAVDEGIEGAGQMDEMGTQLMAYGDYSNYAFDYPSLSSNWWLRD